MFDPINMIAQILGFAALVCAILSFQQNDHKKIMLFQTIGSGLFSVHFFLLGAYTGAILNVLSLIRSGIYYHKDKEWASKAFWPYLFCLFFAAATIFTWQGIISLLPLAGCFVYTLSFNFKDPKKVRVFSSLSSPCWLIYNFLVKSWPGVITEVLNLTSIIIGYLRFDTKKTAEERKKNLENTSPLLIITILSAAIIAYQAVVQSNINIPKYLSITITPIAALINFSIVFLFMLFVYALTNRISVSFWVTYIPLTVALIVNNYKIFYRDEPLRATDFLLAKETGKIMENYDITINWGLLSIVSVCTILGILILKKLKLKKQNLKFRIISLILSAAIFSGAFAFVYQNETLNEFINQNTNEFYQVDVSNNKGLLFYLASTIKAQICPVPEGYSAEEAKAFLDLVPIKLPEDGTATPNVIAIMSESFADLSGYAENLHFIDGSPLKNYEKLKKESIYGDILVPGFAGGTAFSEFEFLTAANVSLINKDMPDIYTSYINKNLYSVARLFKEMDYSTLAIHPGYPWFYNRQNVYKYMGFDDYITRDNLPSDVEKINYYISDAVTADLICSSYEKHLKENPDKGYFNFTVTIQNHGPYMDYETERDPVLVRPEGISDELYNAMNNYFLGLGDADALLGKVTEYINTIDKPTVLLFFGDHLPFFDSELKGYNSIGYDIDVSTTEGYIHKFSTPYLICGNKAARESMQLPKGDRGLISSNYLATELFEYIKLKNSPYFNFVTEMKHELPVIAHSRFFLGDEVVETPGMDLSEKINKYKKLQYYILRSMY